MHIIQQARSALLRFELVISASDSAADVAQRVEEQAGLPHGGRLLLNGVEVAPSSSLASYGVRAGAVLELVPHETGPPAALPPGSPLLSSPQHELVRCIVNHINTCYVDMVYSPFWLQLVLRIHDTALGMW